MVFLDPEEVAVEGAKFMAKLLGFLAIIVILQLGAMVLLFLSRRYIAQLITAYPKISAVLLSILVFGFGWVLSLWKQRHLWSYGAIEAAFGLVWSFNNLLYISPTFALAKVLAAVSGVYIISRGFNNIADSRRLPVSSKAALFSAEAFPRTEEGQSSSVGHRR